MQYPTQSKYRSCINSVITSFKIVLISAVLAIPAFTQQFGGLDPTFGNGGKVLDGISHADDYANSSAIQPDGKIVVAGECNSRFALARYNPDGSLDATFGLGGKVRFSIGPNYDAAYAVALQPDGKIIAAGTSYIPTNDGYRYVFAILRLSSNGSLDTSFGVGGKTTTTLGPDSRIRSIALLSNGKIVAGGYSASASISGFALARYNSNGSLDSSFGSGGIVTTSFSVTSPSGYAQANAIAIQTDGKIVAGGAYNDSGPPNLLALARYNSDGSLDSSFALGGRLRMLASAVSAVSVSSDGKILAASYFQLARFTPNGSPDTSFGNGGTVATPITSRSMAVQSDGKIVTAGTGLARYNPDGSPDGSFGAGGVVQSPFGAVAVAVQSDGKILVGGSSNSTPSNNYFDFALARFAPDGSSDPTFDTDGTVTTDFGIFVGNALNAVATLADGKIVVAGSSRDSLAIARYLPNGSPDTSFGSYGKVTAQVVPAALYSIYDRISLAIQPDGKMVIGSHVYYDYEQEDYLLVRYDSGGAIDNTFGDDGIVRLPIAGVAVALQPDGKIVSAGDNFSFSGNRNFALARFNSNGSADTTFGDAGIVSTDFGAYDSASSVLLQPDGKIVAVGIGEVESGSDDFAAARYNTDGSLDTSFDFDGKVTTPVGSGVDSANFVALQSDGKIIAAGVSINNSTRDFALVRYNANGSLDNTFGSAGKVITPIGLGEANSVVVQSDGKILATGYNYNGTNEDFALVRYNPNGSLDTTFSGDGISILDFDNSWERANGSVLDRRGRAVVVGTSDGAFALTRFLLAPRPAPFDFDGDGRSDISVFRPSDSIWYLNRSAQGFTSVQFGTSTDKIVPADYDGDGKTDIAVYRNGTWWILRSSDGTPETRQFGNPGDLPVPADYTGDGRDELAVYRGGQWWTFDLANGQAALANFGLASDKPVPADYDGDGRVDQAIYRHGEWHIYRSSQGYSIVPFGLPTDKPVVGDYDGDGRADLAVYREGIWYLQQSTAGFGVFQWGVSTDTPAPADYDGDGKTDPTVFRDGVWYQRRSSAGILIQQFGLNGDLPLAASFIR